MDVTTTGMRADYEISVKFNKEAAAGDLLYIRFPKEYDPFLGASEVLYASQPFEHYLACSSD